MSRGRRHALEDSPQGCADHAAGVLHVVAYSLFATAHTPLQIGAAFVLAEIGFAETSASATVALGLAPNLRANVFGVLGLAQSVGDLEATVVVGLVCTAFSPSIALGCAGGVDAFYTRRPAPESAHIVTSADRSNCAGQVGEPCAGIVVSGDGTRPDTTIPNRRTG